MSNFNDMFTGVPSPEEARQNSIDAFVAESKANRELCYSMADEMAMNVANDPKVFQSYLDMQSKFPNYSVNNVLLVLKQMPQAIQLGDLSYWKNQKNYIRRNELNKYVNSKIYYIFDNEIVGSGVVGRRELFHNRAFCKSHIIFISRNNFIGIFGSRFFNHLK